MASHFGIAQSASTRCALLLGVLSCIVPLAARASSCPEASISTCFVNLDGNASTNTVHGATTFSLGDSTLTQIGNITGSNLGNIAFTTGGMVAGGSLAYGAVFNGGGQFFINGTYGNITGGTLFSGSFSGPVDWILDSATNCTTCSYTLSGTISGTWYVHGTTLTNGATVQINFTSNGLYKGGKITDVGGVSYLDVPAIPEPASVGFVGTGLILMGLLVRRRAKEIPKTDQAA